MKPSRAAALVASVAALGIVVGSLLPWTVSGQAERNSFSTVRSARLLAVAGDGLPSVGLGLWYFVPALVAGSVLALVLQRERTSGALAALVGAFAVGLALVVRATPIGRGIGVVPTLGCGAVAMVAGLVAVVSRPPS